MCVNWQLVGGSLFVSVCVVSSCEASFLTSDLCILGSPPCASRDNLGMKPDVSFPVSLSFYLTLSVCVCVCVSCYCPPLTRHRTCESLWIKHVCFMIQ